MVLSRPDSGTRPGVTWTTESIGLTKPQREGTTTDSVTALTRTQWVVPGTDNRGRSVWTSLNRQNPDIVPPPTPTPSFRDWVAFDDYPVREFDLSGRTEERPTTLEWSGV